MRTYRASSLGSCTRSQIALQLGMAAVGTPDRMQQLYDRGVDHEAECLAAMAADGWTFAPANWLDLGWDDDQHYVELEVAGAKITGHLDGLADQGDDRLRVLEIKSPASWHKWEAAHKTGDYTDPLMHRYAWQISVYMAATGLEAVVACVEDGQVRTFGIEVAPVSAHLIAPRVEFMEEHVKAGALPDFCSQVDYPCPTVYLHDRPEVVEDPILDGYLAEYAECKADKDLADQRMRGLRDIIDAHLGLSDTLTTAAGTVTRVPASQVTDWKATAEKLAKMVDIDVAEYVVKKPRAGYVNVTPKVATDE